MTGPVLELRELSVALGRRTVLETISFAIERGQLVAVVGPNGAGKTTLLRAIAGLVRCEGSLAMDGAPLDRMAAPERARRIAYLPQGHQFHWPIAVADAVALGRLPHGLGDRLSPADRAAVERAVAETGIGEFLGRSVTELSGGERARVALARVLAVESGLILADEPTASLDPRYQLTVLGLLRGRAETGAAVMAVIHDLALASRFADRVLVIDRGRLVADGNPADVLDAARLAETFGVTAALVERDGTRAVVPWSLS